MSSVTQAFARRSAFQPSKVVDSTRQGEEAGIETCAWPAGGQQRARTHRLSGRMFLSMVVSETPELFDGLLDGLVLLDVGIHGVLFEIHLLGQLQHLRSLSARNYHHPIGICRDDIPGMHRYAVANHRNIRTRKAIVVDR